MSLKFTFGGIVLGFIFDFDKFKKSNSVDYSDFYEDDFDYEFADEFFFEDDLDDIERYDG